jgi:hypothetical protein
MLGPAKCRATDDVVTISLDDLVPANHFYRHLDTCLDLSFIRDWVADTYPTIGRPSVDPVVVFKRHSRQAAARVRSHAITGRSRAERGQMRAPCGYRAVFCIWIAGPVRVIHTARIGR